MVFNTLGWSRTDVVEADIGFSAGGTVAVSVAMSYTAETRPNFAAPIYAAYNWAIKGNGVSKKGAIVGKGGTSKVVVALKPGKYTFYCSVPGHEVGGMKGTLTVTK